MKVTTIQPVEKVHKPISVRPVTICSESKIQRIIQSHFPDHALQKPSQLLRFKQSTLHAKDRITPNHLGNECPSRRESFDALFLRNVLVLLGGFIDDDFYIRKVTQIFLYQWTNV